MATASDISKGAFIRYNNELCVVTEFEHRTPGNLRAFYQVKMKNIRTGKSLENRFRPGETVELVRVEVKSLQYLYKENNSLVCMDNDTYEQLNIPEELFGESLKFLKENMDVLISFDGDIPVYAETPVSVELEVTYTEPGIKGDTATKTLKPATLETGAVINVPIFIEIGERIKVDTRSGDYIERVK